MVDKGKDAQWLASVIVNIFSLGNENCNCPALVVEHKADQQQV